MGGEGSGQVQKRKKTHRRRNFPSAYVGVSKFMFAKRSYQGVIRPSGISCALNPVGVQETWWDMFIYMFIWGVPKIGLPHVTPIHQNNSTILQDGAPKIAKLVYKFKWLISMVYGRYNELVFMGVISWLNQRSHHWGAPSCSIETHGDDWGIPHFRKRKPASYLMIQGGADSFTFVYNHI